MFNRNNKIVLVAAVAMLLAMIASKIAGSMMLTEEESARIAANIPPVDAGPPGPPPPAGEQPTVSTFEGNPFAKRANGKLVPSEAQVKKVRAADEPYRTIRDGCFLLAMIIPVLTGCLLGHLQETKQAVPANANASEESAS